MEKEALEHTCKRLIADPRPCAVYMRAKFREKGLMKQNVFLSATSRENGLRGPDEKLEMIHCVPGEEQVAKWTP